MRLTEELNKRNLELTELLHELDKTLPGKSEEKLRISVNAGYPRYYIRSNSSDRLGKYVRKTELSKATAIAQRDYDMALRSAAIKEQTVINNLLNTREQNLPEDIYGRLILPRKQLVDPRFLSDEEYAAMWLAEPYKPKGFKDGDIIYHSTDGTRVRSKSEALLKDMFDKFAVPSKFECPLKLWNGKIIHPDFTLLNVRERIVYIWEHFGKADDAPYMDHNTGRLNDMIKSGFYPGINLIMTFETKATPLDLDAAELLIKQFLI